jgi:homoserine kinase
MAVMTDRHVTAFAPATVSNVACGFDVLGFALEAPGDEVRARFSSDGAPGIVIDRITGDDNRLPREASRNTASVAAQALLRALGDARGIVLSIAKGLPLASGLGGSAASAAAAVVAVDALLEAQAPLDLLIQCAIEGEGLGARTAHPDNIAPALCGGFVLVRHPDPPDIVRLPVPAGLMAVVVHPEIEIETAKARALLGTTVPLADAIRQWANMGALVDGLHRGDFALISRALEDTIAEPRRAPLVPGLAQIKQSAVDAGALGCSLSGSGPSLFALCRGADVARRVAGAMTIAVKAHISGEPQTYVSAIAPQGARVVSSCAS